ncbi:glycosyltransferase [Actinacidiphila bryophytorum]|uniref:GDP-mannose-dependent alpha-(1-6)-phosphatidylinositol dimannoside mannosyltransferase n=2 Tax=Actinacidiphila bryophytorum TaxID=1436133 RepID=A0A9W4E5C4_9ACTN|nr:glycosyltransferase [Actinacidiphila bryophytorum]MBM9439250.1 glycosyltransferase [Actinacidiphila bryophytorum]CAG7619962.1 GDP-mannose-dependent alpha-(1-6)-phosphatidylinositol dimannoside mannosyltransferase [Actinacidiphila bryophytorum]
MTAAGLRIVRVANFVTPVSGGLRTALRHLGEGYAAAGHEPVLVIPGPEAADEHTAQGRVITLPGPEIPGTGGYRVLARRTPVAELLEKLAPDRLEVSDRTTLRWTGEWARRHRVPAVMVSHESADGVLGTWGLPAGAARRAADALNRRTAHAYTRVVCTTAWAAAEFERIGARNVVRAPLGVDLAGLHPGHHDAALRERYAHGAAVMLVLCSRLSPEKRPDDALEALARLRAAGVDAALVVAGDGPLRTRLTTHARTHRLPVTFLGHVARRDDLAALLATADVALAPGPVETFGLAALEALACGTPVVASTRSALPDLIGPAGASATTPAEYAAAVRRLLTVPPQERRTRARTRAELYTWPAAVTAFLTAHKAPTPTPAGAPQ